MFDENIPMSFLLIAARFRVLVGEVMSMGLREVSIVAAMVKIWASIAVES